MSQSKRENWIKWNITAISPSPPGDCVAIGKLLMIVILNGVKNLMISSESTIEILRLSPQSDITTRSPGVEGMGEGESHRRGQ